MKIDHAPRALARVAALAALVALSLSAAPAMADEAVASSVEPAESAVAAPDPVEPDSSAPPEAAGGVAPVEVPAASTAAPAASTAAPAPTDPCFPGACIDNGTVLLGVNPAGSLNLQNAAGSASGDRNDVGIHFLPTGNDGAVAGSPYEGWGVADPATGVWGGANVGQFGPSGANLTVESFDATGSTATSVVTVGNVLAPTFRVTHRFYPSPRTPNLYVIKVTIENLTDNTIDQVLYRRLVDWDIEPTEFDELVTIATGDASAILRTSNDGFEDTNPLTSLDGDPGDFEDNAGNGSGDYGAVFDLALGPLASGKVLSFFLYYGAAATEAEAKAALGEVGAEAYSFGQTSDGGVTGAPNTFILGFSGVGGTPIFADPTPGPADDGGDDVAPVSAEVKAATPAVVVENAQLPATGASIGQDIAPIAVLLVAAGIALVAFGRRREVAAR